MVIKFLSDIFSHIVVVAGPEYCHKVGHNGYDINTEKRIFKCPFLLVFQLVFELVSIYIFQRPFLLSIHIFAVFRRYGDL